MIRNHANAIVFSALLNCHRHTLPLPPLSNLIYTIGKNHYTAIHVTEEIHCAQCQFLLYYGETIAERLYLGGLDEEKVLKRYNNTCPKCGNKLSTETVKIEIKQW